MKNKLMRSRTMFGRVVTQRIDNEMLCVSDLMDIYEQERLNHGWVKKDYSQFFNSVDNKEYLIELIKLLGYSVNLTEASFMKTVKEPKKSILKELKKIGLYSTKGRGQNKRTYCNPYIFIALAQWLNPKFRAYVTIWATDQLILNRIEAGVKYNKLCCDIHDYILPKLESDNAKKFIYSNFAKLINKFVFGKHEQELRQVASKQELIKLNDIQIELGALMKVGHVNYPHLKGWAS